MSSVTRHPTVIDLFAGCGGMTRGFVQEGFVPVQAVELELPAAATYAANFGEDHMFWGDIADWPTADIPQVDVVIGGPPCQGLSNLGTKDVDDPRNKLWKEYLRVVAAAPPKVCVLENVKRFMRGSEFRRLLGWSHRGLGQDLHIHSGVPRTRGCGVSTARPKPRRSRSEPISSPPRSRSTRRSPRSSRHRLLV